MNKNTENICPPPSVVENNPYISVCGRKEQQITSTKHKFQFSKDELQNNAPSS